VFGRPSTMSERETTPLVFTEKAPLRQAVVTAAADAPWVLPRVAATSAVATASRQAAATVRKRRSVYRAGMSPSQDVAPYYVRNRRADHPSGLAAHAMTMTSPGSTAAARQRLRVLFERKLPSGLAVSCEGGPLGSVLLPLAWTDRGPAAADRPLTGRCTRIRLPGAGTHSSRP